jgi:hypothetical protein
MRPVLAYRAFSLSKIISFWKAKTGTSGILQATVNQSAATTLETGILESSFRVRFLESP